MRDKKIRELLEQYPYISTYLEDNQLHIEGFEDKTYRDFLEGFSEEELEDNALDIKQMEEDFFDYIMQMQAFLGLEEDSGVHSLTILPGRDKSGREEGFEELTIRKSQIVSIVGPTGSGKSRLLADIEWTAQRDTPTNREIRINGELPDKKWRFSSNNKLVAQLSQNMNFVMDLSVKEFLELHAQSRMVDDIEGVVGRIIEEANRLAGEKFAVDTQITALSGGQSRALMIADTAILSKSPIVLIDEIENAGIDRKKALELLVSEDKIVLMATHDPLLALMADKRIVISNGGISKVMETTQEEKLKLVELQKMDDTLQEVRRKLRYGEEVL
ncbi:MAG: ATP-binding cassette domain-containing protein [Filifactor alocis]|nr:ATP-binding cassette domain-containing protein [Filifactor alocis]